MLFNKVWPAFTLFNLFAVLRCNSMEHEGNIDSWRRARKVSYIDGKSCKIMRKFLKERAAKSAERMVI